jgi:hypothetical protein
VNDTAAPRLSPAVLDGVATVLLAVAGLATSWVGYQAARWSGVQAAHYTEANALRVESTRASTAAGQRQAIDVGLFTAWVAAYSNHNDRLDHFLRARFRPEFQPAFAAWLASDPRHNTDAAPSPFVLPEYRVRLADSAVVLERQSGQAFAAAQAANQQSDLYVLDAVVLATVLFFAGISQQMRWRPARIALLTLAGCCCVIGIATLTRYPVA